MNVQSYSIAGVGPGEVDLDVTVELIALEGGSQVDVQVVTGRRNFVW